MQRQMWHRRKNLMISKRTLTKKERLIAGGIAACSVIILVVSLLHFVPLDPGTLDNLLATTTAEQEKTTGTVDNEETADTDDAPTDTASSDSPEGSDSEGVGASETADSSSSSSSGSSDSASGASGTTGGSSGATGSGESGSQPSTQNPAEITITVSIDCLTAVNKGYDAALAVSSSGYMRDVTLILDAGSTVYDALRYSGAVVGSKTTTMGIYVYSIDSLSEKACGSTSGWVYSVNGAYPNKSCDSYVLQEGDSVRWRYTCTPGDV